jgi:rhodanese-related sulfurtransferase
MNQVSVDVIKQKLDAGETLYVIDVREPDEYEEVNINAVLMPLSQLRNFDFDAIENLKDEELFVHCKSGMRSMQACMILEQAGFANTNNVEGGILAWLQKYPEVKLP